MAELVRGETMNRILNKYMKDYFPLKYFERDKAFCFYTYYSNAGTFVRHMLTAEKDRIVVQAELPFEMMYDDDYFAFQIEAIAKINNDLEYGYIEVNDEGKSITFCAEFTPCMKYSEFTEHYFMDNIHKLSFYGQDVLDAEFGEMLNNSLADWWTA